MRERAWLLKSWKESQCGWSAENDSGQWLGVRLLRCRLGPEYAGPTGPY